MNLQEFLGNQCEKRAVLVRASEEETGRCRKTKGVEMQRGRQAINLTKTTLIANLMEFFNCFLFGRLNFIKSHRSPLLILWGNWFTAYTMTTVTTTETNVPDLIRLYRRLLFYRVVSRSVRSDLCYRIRTELLLNRLKSFHSTQP